MTSSIGQKDKNEQRVSMAPTSLYLYDVKASLYLYDVKISL